MKYEMMVVVFQIILDIAVEILKMIEEFQMQMEWR